VADAAKAIIEHPWHASEGSLLTQLPIPACHNDVLIHLVHHHNGSAQIQANEMKHLPIHSTLCVLSSSCQAQELGAHTAQELGLLPLEHNLIGFPQQALTQHLCNKNQTHIIHL
jgi:hypothetical protein